MQHVVERCILLWPGRRRIFGNCPWSPKFFIQWLRALNKFSTNWKPRRFKFNQFPAIIAHVLTANQLVPKACLHAFAARDETSFRTWFCVFSARFCLVDQTTWWFTTLRFLFTSPKHSYTWCCVQRTGIQKEESDIDALDFSFFFSFLLCWITVLLDTPIICDKHSVYWLRAPYYDFERSHRSHACHTYCDAGWSTM